MAYDVLSDEWVISACIDLKFSKSELMFSVLYVPKKDF